MEPTFYFCTHCGNLVEMIRDKGVQVVCCGEAMTQLVANTSEGAAEKHLPVLEQSGRDIRVAVGSIHHPMTEEHSIEWIYLNTVRGGQRVDLSANGAPLAQFTLAADDSALGVYAYCNLHGLWKTIV